jgi:hypothetical protein
MHLMRSSMAVLLGAVLCSSLAVAADSKAPPEPKSLVVARLGLNANRVNVYFTKFDRMTVKSLGAKGKT